MEEMHETGMAKGLSPNLHTFTNPETEVKRFLTFQIFLIDVLRTVHFKRPRV